MNFTTYILGEIEFEKIKKPSKELLPSINLWQENK